MNVDSLSQQQYFVQSLQLSIEICPGVTRFVYLSLLEEAIPAETFVLLTRINILISKVTIQTITVMSWEAIRRLNKGGHTATYWKTGPKKQEEE